MRPRFYVIDAYRVAREAGLGVRINTIMQTCFFAIAGVLPSDEAIAHIKQAIESSYGKSGPLVVEQNRAAVDRALAHLHQVPLPEAVTATRTRPPIVAAEAPDFVQRVTAVMLAGRGDALPVSAFPVDGTWPTATANSGVWPLYRFDPRRLSQGQPPLQLDCNPPTVPVKTYMQNETRFRMVERMDAARFKHLAAAAQREATQRFALYQQLAGVTLPVFGEAEK